MILLLERLCWYRNYIDGLVIPIDASMRVVQDNEALEELTEHSHSSCPYQILCVYQTRSYICPPNGQLIKSRAGITKAY
jgi:hypothetical protein